MVKISSNYPERRDGGETQIPKPPSRSSKSSRSSRDDSQSKIPRPKILQTPSQETQESHKITGVKQTQKTAHENADTSKVFRETTHSKTDDFTRDMHQLLGPPIAKYKKHTQEKPDDLYNPYKQSAGKIAPLPPIQERRADEPPRTHSPAEAFEVLERLTEEPKSKMKPRTQRKEQTTITPEEREKTRKRLEKEANTRRASFPLRKEGVVSPPGSPPISPSSVVPPPGSGSVSLPESPIPPDREISPLGSPMTEAGEEQIPPPSETETLDQAISRLNEEISNIKMEILRLGSESNDLELVIKLQSRDIAKKQQQAKEEEEALAQAQRDKRQATKEETSATNELEKCKAKCQKAEKNLADFNTLAAEISQLEKDINITDDEQLEQLEEEEIDFQDLDKAVKQAQKEQAQATEALTKAKARVIEAENAIKVAEEARQKTTEEIISLGKEQTSSQEKLATIKSQIKSLEETFEEVQDKLEEREMQKKE